MGEFTGYGVVGILCELTGNGVDVISLGEFTWDGVGWVLGEFT